jgi:hypothetical protein
MTTTHLEQLSNELFYDIFGYLDAQALYDAFSDQNIRFHSLLNAQTLQFKWNSSLDSNCRERYTTLVNHCRHRIITLDIHHHRLIVDSSFIRLESLKCIQLAFDRILLLLPMLTCLPRLRALTIEFNDYQKQDLTCIYQLVFRLPVLKYGKISSNALQTIIQMPAIKSNSTSDIECLIIDHPCAYDELIRILHYVPKLHTLTCRELSPSRQHITSHVLVKLSQLTYLRIHYRNLMFDTLEMFIGNFGSSLKVLYIRGSDHGEQYLHSDQWEQLFERTRIRLTRFILHLTIYLDTAHALCTYRCLLKDFRLPYWIEQAWFFKMTIDWSYGVQYDITYRIHS